MIVCERTAEIVHHRKQEWQILGDAIEGEAREVGVEQAELTKAVAERGERVALISGGETTVTVRGSGRGGRNAEYLLALGLALEGQPGVSAVAADTDGIDGSEDNAGAFADGNSWARMREAGLDPAASLAGHDAWTAFDRLGDIFAPGPTGTNVNDFRAILLK